MREKKIERKKIEKKMKIKIYFLFICLDEEKIKRKKIRVVLK